MTANQLPKQSRTNSVPMAINPGAEAQAEVSGKQQELKGLILAQNERWRRGLGMQVERA